MFETMFATQRVRNTLERNGAQADIGGDGKDGLPVKEGKSGYGDSQLVYLPDPLIYRVERGTAVSEVKAETSHAAAQPYMEEVRLDSLERVSVPAA